MTLTTSCNASMRNVHTKKVPECKQLLDTYLVVIQNCSIAGPQCSPGLVSRPNDRPPAPPPSHCSWFDNCKSCCTGSLSLFSTSTVS